MVTEYSPLGRALIEALQEQRAEEAEWEPDARRWRILQLRAEGKTQREVAEELGISTGRVGQLERDTERRLRLKYAP